MKMKDSSVNLFLTYRGFFLLACGLVMTVFFGRLFFQAKGDISYFILANERRVVKSELLDSTIFIHKAAGYDGLLFYRYSIDPWSIEQDEHGIKVALPAYRKQRILYPLLTHIVSMGKAEAIPWIMVMLNLLGFILILYFFYLIAMNLSLPPPSVLAPIGVAGLWMSLGRNTAEITEGLFLVMSLYFLIRKKWFWFTLAACLAVFTREGVLVLYGGGAIATLIHYRKDFKQIITKASLFALPLILFVAYRAYLIETMIKNKMPDNGDFLSWPFLGIIEAFQGAVGWTEGLKLGWIELGSWVLGVAWILLLIFDIVRGWKKPAEAWQSWLYGAFFMWSGFILMMTKKIFSEDWGFVRISTSYFLLALILLLWKYRMIPLRHGVIMSLMFVFMVFRLWTTT